MKPITLASVHKSIAMSRGPTTSPAPAPIVSTSKRLLQWKCKSWKSRTKDFMKIFCLQSDILKKYNKQEEQMAFYIKRAEQQLGTAHVEEEGNEVDELGWEDDRDEKEEGEENSEQVMTYCIYIVTPRNPVYADRRFGTGRRLAAKAYLSLTCAYSFKLV